MTGVVRRTGFDIAPIFLERWSPRSFLAEVIPDEVLLTCFEAARWAPSGFNLQPWRFVYAKRDTASWAVFLDLLSETNQAWAASASALVLFISKTTVIWNGQEQPAVTHSFDAGAAWSNFAHQARLLGWHTHAMGGFDRKRARLALDIPEGFAIDVIAAIGRRGSKADLPAKLQDREFPSDRLPLEQLVMEGQFQAK